MVLLRKEGNEREEHKERERERGKWTLLRSREAPVVWIVGMIVLDSRGCGGVAVVSDDSNRGVQVSGCFLS